MANYQFEYRDLTISVTVDIDNRKMVWENTDGVIEEYNVDKFIPDMMNKKIFVGYNWEQRGKVTGTVINTGRDEYTELAYPNFYYAVTPLSVGEFCSRNVLNGLVRRLPAFGGSKLNPTETRIFSMPDGTFYQPIILDPPTVSYDGTNGEATVTANVVNGIAPYGYILDPTESTSGGQSDPEFTGVSIGEHVIRITDSAGTVVDQTFTIEGEE